MSWIYLISAICLEVIGTTFMKLSDGMSNLYYTLGMVVAYFLCFACLSLSLKGIELSVAYAIWSALGVVIISILGIMYFHETLNLIKVVSTFLIIIGVVGLKLSTGH